MERHAVCLSGNKCSWTLKSGDAHQPASTLVNQDSPQNTMATQKKNTLGNGPWTVQSVEVYPGRLLWSSQVGRGQILGREQSRDLLPHGTTFLCPGLCWKLQRWPWYAKRCRTGASVAGKGLLAASSYGMAKEVTSREGCSTHTDYSTWSILEQRSQGSEKTGKQGLLRCFAPS